MFFWIKKFIAGWLMPLPFCLTLIAAGWWMGRSSRRAGCGRTLVAIGAALLIFFSNNFASIWLLRPLESRYAPMPGFHPGGRLPATLAACRYVVVLGGGHEDMAAFAATTKLSVSSLARIVEGVRLLRALPGDQMVVSGPAIGIGPSHASVLAAAAVALGVDPTRIRLIVTARDTEDESRAVKSIVGDAPIALVTSAWHMPRAVADFRAAGVNALPCPTDFQSRFPDGFHWTAISWDAASLERSTVAVHERLGQIWMLLRGKQRGHFPDANE